MAPPFEFAVVRAVVFAVGGAQALFWLYTLSLPRDGLVLLDLVIIWLTAPALFFGAHDDWAPLGAGLATASLAILLGLLMM